MGALRHRPHAARGAAVPSERKNADGTCRRVGDDALRAGLAEAAAVHLPAWAGKLSPHVLRHYRASELYLSGMDLISIQEALGHAWVATTMNYINSRELHQPGEKLHVSSSQDRRNDFPHVLMPAL